MVCGAGATGECPAAPAFPPRRPVIPRSGRHPTSSEAALCGSAPLIRLARRRVDNGNPTGTRATTPLRSVLSSLPASYLGRAGHGVLIESHEGSRPDTVPTTCRRHADGLERAWRGGRRLGCRSEMPVTFRCVGAATAGSERTSSSDQGMSAPTGRWQRVTRARNSPPGGGHSFPSVATTFGTRSSRLVDAVGSIAALRTAHPGHICRPPPAGAAGSDSPVSSLSPSLFPTTANRPHTCPEAGVGPIRRALRCRTAAAMLHGQAGDQVPQGRHAVLVVE